MRKFIPLIAVLALFACGEAKDDTPIDVPVTMFDGEEAHLSNIRMLTNGGENAEAYFPPEEDRLVFQSKRGDLTADQIFVMNLDGTGVRMISNGKGATTCSYLWPGSKRVLYATTAFAGDEPPAPPDRSKGYVWKLHPEFDIVAHDLDGKNEVRLTDAPGYDAEAMISRDGEWIVFTSCRDGDPEIYKMRSDGSELTRLTNAEGYDGGPFFSFDGKRIVWRANRPETEEEKKAYITLRDEGLVSPMRLEVFVMDADGTNIRQVTDNGAANFGPFFHPDGERIIFCSNLGSKGKRGMPNFDLWIINVDGTGLDRVTHCPSFDGFPMFTNDGKTLVFCSNRDNGDTSDTNVFLADWKN
jgi:Tol biopolymer transport system component